MEETVMDQQSIMERQKTPHMEKVTVETTADQNLFEKISKERGTTYVEVLQKKCLLEDLTKEQTEEMSILLNKKKSKWNEIRDLERQRE